jgi:hypothetical protein
VESPECCGADRGAVRRTGEYQGWRHSLPRESLYRSIILCLYIWRLRSRVSTMVLLRLDRPPSPARAILPGLRICTDDPSLLAGDESPWNASVSRSIMRRAMVRILVSTLAITIASCASVGRSEVHIVASNDTMLTANVTIRLDGRVLFSGNAAVAVQEPNIAFTLPIVIPRGTHRLEVSSGDQRKELVFEATPVATVEIRLLPHEIYVSVSPRRLSRSARAQVLVPFEPDMSSSAHRTYGSIAPSYRHRIRECTRGSEPHVGMCEVACVTANPASPAGEGGRSDEEQSVCSR